jgi:hypothetical protein
VQLPAHAEGSFCLLSCWGCFRTVAPIRRLVLLDNEIVSCMGQAVSRGLFLFLERSISRQLSSLYKANPKNADEWLADEIYRAACDPGALGVFQ